MSDAINAQNVQNPPPIDGLTAATQATLGRLRDGPRQIRDIMNTYQQTVAERGLEISHDENLSAEGRDAAMRRMREQAGEAAAAQLERLRASLDQDYGLVRRNLESRWPAPAAGLEALLSRQAAWARCRSLLEAGVGAKQLLGETTDIEVLHALREELPTWIRANAGRIHWRIDTRIIDGRLAELAGERTSAALMAARRADEYRAYCEPILTQAYNESRGLADRNTGLAAAVKAEYERQRVVAGGTLPIGGDTGDAA